ncbi:hypothetical protein STEG23_001473 [Scotinomys teguina]
MRANVQHSIDKWQLRWLTWQRPASDKMAAQQRGHQVECAAAAATYITRTSHGTAPYICGHCDYIHSSCEMKYI